MPTIYTNAILLTPFEKIAPGAVAVSESGDILYAGLVAGAPETGGKPIDLGGKIVMPGFIDVHVHGGIGVSFGEGDPAGELRRYSAWVTSTGVTGYFCSLAASGREALLALVLAYAGEMQAWRNSPGSTRGAEPLGIHLEGPYLNPEKKGAFNPAWLRKPALHEVEILLEAGQGWIRQVTLAPELPGAPEAARRFKEAGVVVALGHSSADFELASAALAGDFMHVTHAFNAQSGFHHRQPGVFGAVMASDGPTAELIADGVHVHPGAMKVLYRCLGNDRVVLITDAMSGAGLPDGKYELVGNPVTVKDGQARLSDGTIAGSTAAMHACVWNMHALVGVPLLDAVRMASWNPARVFGLERRLGSLEPGKDANLVVLGKGGEVEMTVVKGEIQYSAGSVQ
jgi:N-acetylglucosamine-6-phosphate deacetylase